MALRDILASLGSVLLGDPTPVPSDPMDPRFWGQGDVLSTSGQSVSANGVLQLDVVQSVLARLGGTISTLPLMIYERLDAPDDEGNDRRPAPEHPLFPILHRRPNARQTAQEFRDDLSFQLCYWRNAYAEISQGADGEISALEPIHPTRVAKIERRGDGRIYYQVARLDGSGQDWFRDDQIMHIRKAPLTADGLRGQYMFESARETFGKALAVEAFGNAYFRNGGSGGGVLEHPGNFRDKEEQAKFLETWRSGGAGLNRHKDRMLLNGVKYTPFAVRNDEAQFLETLKEVAVKICRLWNFPPHMAGILDKATFSNIEQQSTEYIVHCIAPWLSAIEQAIARDLLIGEDADRYFVEFNVAGLLRGDFKTRWAGYAAARQWGWLSVNDIRKLENMAPIGAGGDEYLRPMNMTPTGQPGADGTIQIEPDGDDDIQTQGVGDDD